MARLFGTLVMVLALIGFIASPASAAILTYTTNMDGPSESPPNGSLGTGTSTVTYDNVLHTMRVQATFQGLSGTTSAAHIHAPTPAPFTLTAGVATQTPSFSGFPLGVTSGAMDTTFDLTLASSWNGAFITANGGSPATAETAFFSFMDSGRAYFNIHTSVVGGGEIRGFYVPEPGAMALLGAGAVVAVVRRRRAI